MRETLSAHVVAAPGISTEVTWSTRDANVATVTPDGALTTRCRSAAGSTYMLVESTVDPTKRDSLMVSVFADVSSANCIR